MRNKLIAYGLGILCHLSFGAAIVLMAYMLATGLTHGIFPLGGNQGRVFNIFLILQFPIIHSFFLTKTGSKILMLPFPKEIAKDLLTTSYALVASIQLLIVFLFWTPNSIVWFAPSSLIVVPWFMIYGLSWLLLIKSLSEAGLAMHTGWLGWHSVTNGKKIIYPNLPREGLHGQCRHPIYLSFLLIILTAPVWSFDHFLLASIWVLYCILGPKLKERRTHQRLGDRYLEIKESIPYMIPKHINLCSNQKRFRRS